MPAGTAPWSCTQRSGPAAQPGHAEKLTAIWVNRIKAAYVAREFNGCDLHAQAKTEKGNLVFASEPRRLDFSFHPALSKSARYQNTGHLL